MAVNEAADSIYFFRIASRSKEEFFLVFYLLHAKKRAADSVLSPFPRVALLLIVVPYSEK